MGIRSVGRDVIVATLLAVTVSSVAFADTAPADADLLTAGNQPSRDLGEVVAGTSIDVAVGFTLRCANGTHAERGSTITVTVDSQSIPAGGGVELVTPGSIGSVPTTWPLDGALCPGGTGSPSLAAATPMTLRLTAPMTLGPTEPFAFSFARTPSTDITGIAGVAFTMTVVAPAPQDTTPPVLADVPGDIDVVTGDPAGAIVTWTGPTATDDLDPAPSVGCLPAAGTRFAPGTTTVTCTAMDATGNSATATFDVTVHLGAATFGAPLRAGTPALVAELARVIPLKVAVTLDGQALLPGSRTAPRVRAAAVERCAGAAEGMVVDLGALTWRDDVWGARIDTSDLVPGCWRLAVVLDDAALVAADVLVVDGRAGRPAYEGIKIPS